MKIIDTDIIIDYLNGIKDAQNFLSQISKPDRFVTSINLMELLYGCQNKKEVQETKKFIPRVN